MPTNADLYTQDFYTWAMTTAAKVRHGEWHDLDAEMIAEEIEQLGIARAHALSSYLKQLTLHLLKWYYQPARRQTGHSWASSIVHARQEIAALREENPGLEPQMEALLVKAYARGRRLAQVQTRMPLTTFPPACPWTLEQVLDDDFWPEEVQP
jgi:hypothetical protein